MPAQPTGNNIQAENAIIDNDTGETLEYRHLFNREEYREVWTNSFIKELVQLVQGRAQLDPGTNTLFSRKIRTSQPTDAKMSHMDG